MKLNFLTSLGFALSTALGAVASPVDLDAAASNALDVRDNAVEAGVGAEANVFDEASIADKAGAAVEDGEADILIRYDGTCSNRNNQCRYKAQSGRTAICRCQVKRCGSAHGRCFFNSVNRHCTCY